MVRENFICFDWAAKRLLRRKEYFVVLEGFLTSLLREAIRIVHILEYEGNKRNRIDLLAENSRGELIIVEIQNDRELDYFHRMLYRVSKAITEYLFEKEPYAHVKKMYSIYIVYFELGQGKDYVYHGFYHSTGHYRPEYRGIHFDDTLKLVYTQQAQYRCEGVGSLYPEYFILRVEAFDRQVATPLDEWIYFLKTGEIPEEAKAPGLPEARELLRCDRMSLEKRREYEAHIEALRYQKSVSRQVG